MEKDVECKADAQQATIFVNLPDGLLLNNRTNVFQAEKKNLESKHWK